MIKKADGSRFDSQILAKPHLNPKKVDGPGPGSYELPSSIKKNNRHGMSTQLNTFGNGREVEKSIGNLKVREEYPGPASYNHVYPGLGQHYGPNMNLLGAGKPGYTFAIDGIDPS